MIRTLELLRGGQDQPLSSGTLGETIRRFRLALVAWRQRRRLATLDRAMLRDIGVTPAEAEAEAARPFWDVPPHWLER